MGIIATRNDTELITAVKELAEYLGEDPIATAVNVGNSFFLTAEGWKQRHPMTQEEIAAYYRDDRAYLWHLVFANYGIEAQGRLRKLIVDEFPVDASVLDLGGGIGSTLLAMPQTKKTHADLGGHIFNYAAWRYQKRQQPVEMVQLPDGYTDGRNPLVGRKFDVIVCTEVIEHVTEPEDLLRYLSGLLTPNGKLVATVSFHDDWGLLPCHLNLHRYTDKQFVEEIFPKFGFKRVDGAPLPVFSCAC